MNGEAGLEWSCATPVGEFVARREDVLVSFSPVYMAANPGATAFIVHGSWRFTVGGRSLPGFEAAVALWIRFAMGGLL